MTAPEATLSGDTQAGPAGRGHSHAVGDASAIGAASARGASRPAASPAVRALVSEARRHLAAARTMRRNTRLGHYQGRNSGGSAAAFHEEAASSRLRTLLDSPEALAGGSWQRRLVGLVWSDHSLSMRLSEARDNGQDRPELRSRQQLVRRDIRELLR